MSDKQFDKTKIAERRAVLDKVGKQLKEEFFGLDAIIDKVMKSISAWYIFPELITRPVIINLWGMTGVGKTQLVRRLVALIGFQEAFVEVQMDGGSMKSSYDASTISRLLSQSSIDEGQPGILLLDEIQRFRTVDEHGADVKLERFQDVWTLLSDGKFSADASMFQEIEMMIAAQDYHKDWVSIQEPKEEGEAQKPPKIRKFKLYPYEAQALKKTLRLHNSVQEIMKWDTDRIEDELNKIRVSRSNWEIDYSKLVIFVSGNLDKAFTGSTSTEDCDTDADFYHEETKKITSMHIKDVLLTRFRPEQISRLGNNHVIYPSMSKASYQRLIQTTVQKYIDEMKAVTNLEFVVGQDVLDEIYNNSVFPTQGTRPVFSSVHMIFSSLLANVTFWAIEHDYGMVKMTMAESRKAITVFGSKLDVCDQWEGKHDFPVELEMNEKKAKASIDFKTMVAVHEAGHAVAYAYLMKAAPMEVKINVASFNGGYMLPGSSSQAFTKEMARDRIAIGLAGLVAEELTFGPDQRTTGAGQDIFHATQLASQYVRMWGFDGYVSYVNASAPTGTHWVTALKETDAVIEQLMKTERERVQTILTENKKVMQKLVETLLAGETIKNEDFIKLYKDETGVTLSEKVQDYPFNQKWKEQLNK